MNGPLRDFFDGLSAIFHARRMARRPREQRMKGLRGPVEVSTDRWGVPHIYADSNDDLFFGQGYVTARDRLFQIDYNRHGARGRLCELLGRREIPWRALTVHLKACTTYDVDVMMRSFGIERAARASLEALSEDSRRILKAYTAGINAFLATRPTTLEHRFMGRVPPPWTELDSVVLIKAIGFELNYAWRAILMGALLSDSGVAEDIARVLWPSFPRDSTPIVDHEAWQRSIHGLREGREAASVALGMGNAPGVGSNCFAVAGTHTEDGGALLANDTHLNLIAPIPWHEVRLRGGDYDLQGFQLAGVPGIGIGRTPRFAWGITAGLVHDLDLFLEKLNPEDSEEVLTADGYRPLEKRQEVFHVRGEGAHQRTIYSSSHGPLLETISTQPAEGHRFSVCWTGHHAGRELDTLVEVWRADGLDDFRAALRHHTCPTFNMTYAGADGRIAYLLAGAIPKRKPDTPLRPLEGWTGQWDWDGLVPHAENPHEIDPPRGFCVTANNRVGPASYPHELGRLFEPPDRFERITQRLGELGDNITAEDLRRLQLDTYAPWGKESRDVLLGVVGGAGALGPEQQSVARAAARIWAEWDGFADVDSPGAAVAYVVAHYVGGDVVATLAGEDTAMAFLELSSFTGPCITRLADVEDRLRELGVNLESVIRRAFHRAVDTLRDALGDEPARWRWGDIHPVVIKHRFHDTPIGPLLSMGPEPAAGGPDTVNRGDMNTNLGFTMKLGAALRMVVSANDPDAGRTVIPGGQSGSRFSRHYDDQLKEFLAGRLKPAPVSKDRIDVQTREMWLPEK